MKEELLNRIKALKKEAENLVLEYLRGLTNTSWHFNPQNGEYSVLYNKASSSCGAFYSMDSDQFTIVNYNNYSMLKIKDEKEFIQEWKILTKLANFK